jgi:hypothetical protein
MMDLPGRARDKSPPVSSDQESNIEARLCAYIDGLLDAEQRASIEQYLDRYPEHRQLIDQLMEERSLLRDLPRESAPPDVLAHFQGQLERSVLLGDLETDSARSARDRRRGRWNLAVLLSLLLLAFGVSVIVWIAMPPKRVRQSAATIMAPEPATTMATDTTQSSVAIASTEAGVSWSGVVVPPPVVPVVNHPRAMLVEVGDSNLLLVMISAADLRGAEERADEFLKSRSLRHAMPTTMQSSLSHAEWEVPGMTRVNADELVASFSAVPATAPAATEPAMQLAATQPVATTQMVASTRPNTAPAVKVVILFQTADLPLSGPEKSGS